MKTLKQAVVLLENFIPLRAVLFVTAVGTFGKIFYEKLVCLVVLGYWPQIRNPRSFNEKICHRKYCTDDPRYAIVEDKWSVRKYVRDRVGDGILNDVYYETSRPTEIPFRDLPESFVLKPAHGAGWIEFVENKQDRNPDELVRICQNWLHRKYSRFRGEYWHRNIPRRVLVERYLKNEDDRVPLDYKFYVFHGRSEFIQINIDRFTNHTIQFYNRDWSPAGFRKTYPPGRDIPPPEPYGDMIEIVETLAADFDFMRVDLYNPRGTEIVFGEMTPAVGAGRGRFYPMEADFETGKLWHLD